MLPIFNNMSWQYEIFIRVFPGHIFRQTIFRFIFFIIFSSKVNTFMYYSHYFCVYEVTYWTR